MTESPPSTDPAIGAEHFTRAVTELGDKRAVVANQAIFNAQGIKIVEKGTAINASLYERLNAHKLPAPLEEALSAEGVVTGRSLRLDTELMLEREPFYARMTTTPTERSKRLDVVAATRRDPPELLLRIRQDTPGRGESAQNSIGVGVRIPLGTASRNQPLQAAALSELDVALTTKQRTEERLAADAAMAQAAVHTAEQQLEAERQRSALLRERATLIDRSFKAGETPLPELLRALAAATQADTSFARQPGMMRTGVDTQKRVK